MPALYDLGIGLYHVGIRAAALFSPKAKAWTTGRHSLWQRLERNEEALRGCIWMHCASVGEFEQGRPVLEALKADRPDLPVLLTFFSPSGYEACKDLPLATYVEYLPLDDARNAARFVALLNPSVVLWVRYEFWYHHLAALRLARVPTFLVSGIFRKDQPFFRWYGSAWRTMIGAFDHLFVQDEASRALLAGIGSTNVSVSGDTRFDRVAAIAAKQEELPIARAFTGTGNVLVCGSTWPEDEALLLEAFSTMTQVPKCIVAPHELNEQHLLSVEAKFPKPLVRWSELEGTDPANIAAVLGTEQGGTLLVDRMGLLSRLYRYGDAAYVGGGFGDGIHSLLEAAAWGTPVVFGPDHRKFVEATGLIEQGAGFEVKDAASLSSVLDHLFAQPGARKNASESAARYVDERKGATAHVLERIRPVLSRMHRPGRITPRTPP